MNSKRVAPEGSTVLCPYLMVPSVEAQIEFLVKTFDARITNETRAGDGFIQHGEVVIGDTNVMMGRASDQYPARLSMNFVYVSNVDVMHKRLLANGATEIMPPDDRPYGMRESGVKDIFGNEWWIAQLLNKKV
jgi:PhnB protein